MNRNGPGKRGDTEENNPMVYQEMKHLRAENERLRKERGMAVQAVGQKLVATTEYKPEPRLRPIILDLVVALENFIGPEQGKKGMSIPKELQKALAAAVLAIRPVKVEPKAEGAEVQQ